MYAFQSESRMAILAKWLSVCLRTKWLWVRVPLQSLSIQWVAVLLIWLLVVLFTLPLVVLIYPLVVLVCPLGVLVYSLVVLVCRFVCPLVVLVVLPVSLFITDPYNDNKMIILMNIIWKCRVSTCSNSLKYLGTLFTWCTKTSLSSLQFAFKLRALVLFALSSNKLTIFS